MYILKNNMSSTNLKVMPDLVKFLSLSNPLELCSDNFSDQLCQPGGFNKDLPVGLDGARPPPMYIKKNNMSLTNLKVMPELVKFLSLSNPLELCSDNFLGQLFQVGVSISILLFG
jgi:hypothetical protein